MSGMQLDVPFKIGDEVWFWERLRKRVKCEECGLSRSVVDACGFGKGPVEHISVSVWADGRTTHTYTVEPVTWIGFDHTPECPESGAPTTRVHLYDDQIFRDWAAAQAAFDAQREDDDS